jgi:hypothetical protein
MFANSDAALFRIRDRCQRRCHDGRGARHTGVGLSNRRIP